MTIDTSQAPLCRSNAEVAPPPYPPHMLAWQELCSRHVYLWVTACADLRESLPPRPMPSAEFMHLVGALLHPGQRAVLRELLMELLRDDLVEMIQWYGGEQQ